MLLKQRRFSLKIKRKLGVLHAAKALHNGRLLAHQTGTVAGIAGHPERSKAVEKMQRFKQRKGPFLLLADSVSSALAQARYISPTLRKMAKDVWPGPVTLVFPAKHRLATACYKRGAIAVRVDAAEESRYLAKQCGGFVLSSSLNRKKQPTMPLQRQQYRRFSAWLGAYLPADSQPASQQASQIYRISHTKIQRLR